MNISLVQKLLAVLIIFIIGYLYISLSKNITPSRFITNTYLYVALAIGLSCITILQLSKYNYTLQTKHIIILFILSLVSMFSLSYFKNTIPRHIMWLIFIGCLSVILFPMYQKIEEKGTLTSVILTTFILTVCLSIYSLYSKTDFVSWGSYLFFALLALIILEVCDMIFHSSSKALNKRFKIYSVIAIVLFSAFLLYDTSVLKKKAENLTRDNVNYPAESLGIFLDIVNLFSNISNVN